MWHWKKKSNQSALSVHPEFLLCSEIFQMLLKLPFVFEQQLGILQVSLIRPDLIINISI
jgi:hypothetical protein